MRKAWWSSIILVAFVFLSGCSGSDISAETDLPQAPDEVMDDGVPLPAIEIADIDGTSWTLLFGGGPDGEIEVIDGWPITLTFDGSRLGGTSACNNYGGTYQVDGWSMAIGELGGEDAGCAPDVIAVEQAYLGALPDVNGIDLLGDELVLSGLATELIFRRTDPVAIEDVTQTLWLLEAVLQDALVTPVAGQPATLRIEPAGLLIASSGCRSLRGTYVVAGSEIVLNNFAAEGNCPISLRAQDSAVVSALGDGFIAVVEGDQLTLTSQGNQGLLYRATTEEEVLSLPGTPAPSDAELIDGITWIFTGGDGPDGPIPDPRSISDSQITFVATSDGTYSGQVLCNLYGGQAEIGSGQWMLSVPDAEQEGCGTDELIAMAEAYLAALPLMSEFGIQGNTNRLTTNGSDIELSFERAG